MLITIFDCRHILIVFGGVAGLEESKELDKTIKVLCFNQIRLMLVHLMSKGYLVANRVHYFVLWTHL